MLTRVLGRPSTRSSSFEEYTSFWEQNTICEAGSNDKTETNNAAEKRCRPLRYPGWRLPRVGACRNGEDCASDVDHQSGST